LRNLVSDWADLYATALAAPRKHPVDDPPPITPNPIAPVDEPKKPEPPVGEPDEEEEPDT
jgi:hypothetical protein